MRKIKLGHHHKNRKYKRDVEYAIVSDKDYKNINRYKWVLSIVNDRKYYAVRYTKNADGKRAVIKMHRQLLNAPNDVEVDHIDNNGLNNQRSNIRLCTKIENGYNRTKYANNKSGFKGVWQEKGETKWRARIKVNKKYIHLGRHVTPEIAWEAYKEAAKKYHKEFANYKETRTN